ncbi:MAG: aspartate aminotransferase family protein [Candidatus Eisenbacteria bacterium]
MFKSLGHAMIDQLADLIASVPLGPVTRGESPTDVRQALDLDGPLPEQGAAPGPMLQETARQLFGHSLFNGHPRFFGYITSSPAPIGMLADLLAAAVNPNCGSWTLAPAATEIETQTVRWVAQLIGCPAETSGLLVSGGNMANMVGFWAARAAKADWNIRAAGVAGGRRMRAYASAETHTWIQKAADLSGLGTDSVRFISTGDDLRMDLAALERAIAEDRKSGDLPFLVVGTAGSVSTGAVDDLPAMAGICRREGLWFHVDGAYGGFAAGVEGAPADLRGISEADSVAVDPHKWLYAPLEAGCALVRDREALLRAFSYHPPYYHFQERTVNLVDYGPQNSRGFRALKVWLALRQAGAAGYRRMIADDMALARALADAVLTKPDLELMTHALSITTYRCVPPDLRGRMGEAQVDEHLNTLNREVLVRMQSGGEAFVSNAVLRGRYVLRACIVNFNTRASDIEAVAEISARMGREIDAELRPDSLKPGA